MAMITMYDVPSFKLLIEERWTAVALLYGPPPGYFTHHHDYVVPLAFRMALEKVFKPAEVERVGLNRMAFDYAEWYQLNENHEKQSTSGDGSLPRA